MFLGGKSRRLPHVLQQPVDPRQDDVRVLPERDLLAVYITIDRAGVREDLGIVDHQAMPVAPYARGYPTAPVDRDRLTEGGGQAVRRCLRCGRHFAIDRSEE